MQPKNPRVPVSVHEALIARHFAITPISRVPIEDRLLVDMRDTMQFARLSAEKARRIADAIMDNQMLTLPARHRQIKSEGWRAIEPSLKRIDAVRGRVEHELNQLIQSTSAPPPARDATAAILAGEIRSRLAGLTPTQRRKALDTALGDGDDVVLGAVLTASPMLSGLAGRAEHDVLATRWRQLRFPAEIDRINRVQKALSDLNRAGDLMVGYSTSLGDSEIVAEAEASELAVATALQS